MQKLTCFVIIPSNRDKERTQLIQDDRWGLVEKPSSATKLNCKPISIDFDIVYNNIIGAALRETEKQCEVQIQCIRGVDIKEAGDILSQLLPHICGADITITDLTTHNPNVFLEYGIRLAVKAQLNIVIAHEAVELPFNLKLQRCINYSLEIDKADKAKQEIVNYIKNYVISKDTATSVELSSLIRRNIELYSGRKREQDLNRTYTVAPQLVAYLAEVLLNTRSDQLILKQRVIDFLELIGTVLEKDERGLDSAIRHYKLMTEIKGLKPAKLQELYLKLVKIYDVGPETKELAACYLEKAKKLEE
jgi:hypothetical protein